MAWYHVPYTLHPLAGSDWESFWRTYPNHGPYDSRSRLSRMVAIASVTLRTPVDWIEKSQHLAKIQEHELEEPPLFIIGHWRSGTTLLHNLLSKDPRFAYLNFFQTVVPWTYMQPLKRVRKLVAAVMPKDREMDQIELGLEEPQEEEMALASMTELSFFRCFYFPHLAEQYFNRSVLLKEITPSERAEFARVYEFLLKKLSYANEGRPLLLKNPANTARLDFLREQFPGARFIHMVRNPLHVYSSACNLWDYMFKSFAWNDWSAFDKVEHIIRFYRDMMREHLEQRRHLPEGSLLDVHFEQLTGSRLKTVETIYQRLGIEFTDQARRNVQEHLRATAHHKAKKHRTDPALEERLRHEWDFAFEKWGY